MTGKKSDRAGGLTAAAFLTVLLALLLCILAPRSETLLLFAGSDPEDTASRFMDALCSGDRAAAEALCPGLPADGRAESEDGRRLFALVQENRSWESAGECRRRGDAAEKKILFTYLDVPALTDDMREDVNAALAAAVDAARLSSDVYNDDGSYREEVVLAAWDSALSGRCERAAEFLRTEPVTLTLRYRGGSWQVESGSRLNTLLAGGAA